MSAILPRNEHVIDRFIRVILGLFQIGVAASPSSEAGLPTSC